MKAVFLDSETFSEGIAFNEIEQQVDQLDVYSMTSPEQVIERLEHAEIAITNKVVLDQQILNTLPALKLICVAATGVNNIDLAAAKALGITVKNVSGYAEYTVAQYVFSQILEHYSDIKTHNENTQAGNWQKANTFCLHGKPMWELKDKTIGLVGYGVLAKAVERLALAFGMKVLIAERKVAKTVRSERFAFEYVLSHADIVSLHCPLTSETDSLIDAEALNLMKPNAMLINTARGAVVNSQDLKKALEQQKIALAVLDVLEQEPPPKNHPLLNVELTNLKITGHIAWATMEAQQRLLGMVAENIKEYVNSYSLKM